MSEPAKCKSVTFDGTVNDLPTRITVNVEVAGRVTVTCLGRTRVVGGQSAVALTQLVDAVLANAAQYVVSAETEISFGIVSDPASSRAQYLMVNPQEREPK